MIIFVFYMLIDSLEVLQQLHCGCSLHVDLEGCLLSGTRFVSESFFYELQTAVKFSVSYLLL